MARQVLIDTDTGVDDALALILALRSPELSVKAITTVAGNAEVQQCTRNVLYLLELLQEKGTIPVAQGAAKPLKKRLVTAPEVHGRDGLGNTNPRIRVSTAPRIKAEDLIIEQCRKYRNKLTIIALGPLTNIARALRKNPAVVQGIRSLISMGGAFRVPGNTGPVAEFNYYVDPDAAHVVLNSGLPVTMVPLDLTEQIVLMRHELEYRAKRRASRLAKTILRFTKFYMRYHRRTEGFDGGYLHDPITVAAALDSSLIQTRTVHVDVETKGEWTRGMTVADFRKNPARDLPLVRVALKIDRERFLKLFHERVWT